MRHMTGLSYKQVQKTDKAITVAMAFAETKASEAVEFDRGEVDVDTGASGASRSKRSTTFKGRIGIYKGRRTKEFATVPLPDRKSTRGKRSLTPETKAEMQLSYTKKMHDGVIHMSDGSPALLALAKDAGLPRASVTHGRQGYLRPVKFKKSQLSEKTLQGISKRPAANSSVYYHSIAGNNAAEGLLGNLNKSRSRVNKHGGGATRNALLNQLAAAYMQRAPGLDKVLHAMKTYREYAQSTVAPAVAFGVKLDAPWLPNTR